MRRPRALGGGELLGARWQDLDLERGRLSISQTVVAVGKEVLLSTPKTASGRRTVALDTVTVEALRAHRKRQLEERVALGLGRPSGDDLVFAEPTGEPLRPNALSHAFGHRVKAAKLPPLRFDDLRHTFASLALAAGVHPEVVRERLGHTNIAITLDIYSHAIPAMQEDAAERVAALVFASAETSVGLH